MKKRVNLRKQLLVVHCLKHQSCPQFAFITERLLVNLSVHTLLVRKGKPVFQERGPEETGFPVPIGSNKHVRMNVCMLTCLLA